MTEGFAPHAGGTAAIAAAVALPIAAMSQTHVTEAAEVMRLFNQLPDSNRAANHIYLRLISGLEPDPELLARSAAGMSEQTRRLNGGMPS